MAVPVIMPAKVRAGRTGHARLILRERIISGGVSDPLPSEHVLAKELGVAQSTIHLAMLSLEQEGLLFREGRLRRLNSGQKFQASNNQLINRSIIILSPYRVSKHEQGTHYHKSHGWLEGISDGAIDLVRESDLHAMIIRPDALTPELIQQLVAERPEGLVIPEIPNLSYEAFTALVNPFIVAKIPVAAYCASFDIPSVDRVKSDHESGAYQLTNYLLQQGRKRILPLISSKMRDCLWAKERRRGYERAMLEAGLEPLPSLEIPETDWTGYITEERIKRISRLYVGYLIDIYNQVDALMAITDGDIAYVHHALKLLGPDLNQKIMVTGYDNYWTDTPDCALENIPLVASVEKFNYESGQALVQMIQDRNSGKLPPTPTERVIAPKLITSVS